MRDDAFPYSETVFSFHSFVSDSHVALYLFVKNGNKITEHGLFGKIAYFVEGKEISACHCAVVLVFFRLFGKNTFSVSRYGDYVVVQIAKFHPYYIVSGVFFNYYMERFFRRQMFDAAEVCFFEFTGEF